MVVVVAVVGESESFLGWSRGLVESWSRGLDPREVAFEYSGRRGIYERVISLENSRQGEIDRLYGSTQYELTILYLYYYTIGWKFVMY